MIDIQLKDVLVMKKNHPCGSNQWTVLRIGADFKLRCKGCNHEVMGPRSKFEKNVKSVLSTAHEEYLCRVADGENADTVMDELVASTLAELRSLYQ